MELRGCQYEAEESVWLGCSLKDMSQPEKKQGGSYEDAHNQECDVASRSLLFTAPWSSNAYRPYETFADQAHDKSHKLILLTD